MLNSTPNDALRVAASHHQAGRLAEAEEVYSRILAQRPTDADAMHLLGVLHSQTGRANSAEDLIRRAIAIQPRNSLYHNNLGMVLRSSGQTAAAEIAFRRAAELDARNALAHNNLGDLLCSQGKLEDAARACRKAIQIDRNFAAAYSNLGNALERQGKPSEAITAYRQAVQLRPDLAAAHANLGKLLFNQKRFDDAVAACRCAIRINPRLVEAYTSLGLALKAQGKSAEAADTFSQGLQIDPNHSEALVNLGIVMLEQRRFLEAIASLSAAIIADPDSADAHWNLALAKLLTGDFEGGWAHFEWRSKSKHFARPRPFPQPRWQGEPLNGRTILLYAEQGFGDTIQFVRYASVIAARGGVVVLECQSELYALLEHLPFLTGVVPRGNELPAFDAYCPLLSLPLALNTRLESIPADIPYIFCDATRRETWSNRIVREQWQLNVGLAWAGNPEHKNDLNRSIHWSALAPVMAIKGVRFFSLQKGISAKQAGVEAAGFDLMDYTADLQNFADTAGLIEHLDLVISVDTSVAHLAAAMGKRVWLLLPRIPDWRWLLDRDDSPWYPTMRLFRQKVAGDWAEIIEHVAEALQLMCKSSQQS